MTASASCYPSSVLLKVAHLPKSMHLCHNSEWRSIYILGGKSAELLGQKCGRTGKFLVNRWTFVGGSRVVLNPKVAKFMPKRERSGISASWLTSSQIASSVFTLGTVAVLPFYTLMVVAPKSQLTKRSMDSTVPYVVLGLLYAYLLYLSWTPDTFRMMFASKYWLPELPGIAKMFSSEMTLASAWIHLLVIDLFAARQIFLDGLANDIETRHSVSLCLLFCPIGIVTHVLTKAVSKRGGDTQRTIQ